MFVKKKADEKKLKQIHLQNVFTLQMSSQAELPFPDRTLAGLFILSGKQISVNCIVFASFNILSYYNQSSHLIAKGLMLPILGHQTLFRYLCGSNSSNTVT